MSCMEAFESPVYLMSYTRHRTDDFELVSALASSAQHSKKVEPPRKVGLITLIKQTQLRFIYHLKSLVVRK